MKTTLAVLISVSALSIASCAAGGATINPTAPWIDGFKYGFQVPRRDVQVGTVVAAWKDAEDKVDIICQPAADLNVSNNPGVNVTQGQKDSFKTNAKANLMSLVKVKVGAESTKSVDTQADIRLIAVQDAAKLAREFKANATCVQNGKDWRAAHPGVFFSLVTEVAEVTFVHTVTLKSNASFTAETRQELEKAIGTGASISVEGGEEKRLVIKGDKIFVNYNRDDALLRDL